MRADMRTVVDILRPVVIRNLYGEAETDWQPVFTKRLFSKEPLLGNEFHNAFSTQSKVEIKFRSYYFDGVDSAMRVRDETGVYEIFSAVNVKSLNRELLLYCRKVREDE